MSPNVNLKQALNFLGELKLNNQKTWFEAHRADYQAARGSFELLVNDLIDQLRPSDPLEGLTAKDCIFRIYRDIRFSNDKSPYKTNLAALIAPHNQGNHWFGYYLSLEPQAKSMLAGGLYNPTQDQLNRFRQAIVKDAAEFKEIIQDPAFVAVFGEVKGERLKTAPKGFDREHAEIELLQLKQITAMHYFTDEQVLAPDFTRQVVAMCQTVKPFLAYLKEIAQ